MKKLLLCMLLLAATSTVLAQEPPKNIFGIRAGLSMSSIKEKVDNVSATSGTRTSFHIGISDQIRLAKRLPLYLETGLIFIDKGAKEKNYMGYNGATLKISMLYLQVPLMVNYHFNLGRNWAIIPFAGLYYEFGVGGNTKLEYRGSTQKEDTFGDDSIYGRSDFGGQLGVGFLYAIIFIWASAIRVVL